MKTLLYVCLQTNAIVAVRTAIGTFHDFKMFKQSFHKKGIVLDEKTQIMGDSGFQGMQNLHSNTRIPHKATKKKTLTKEQKAHNKKLAQERVAIEHVNRACKIFRITKETYRGKHKKFNRNWNIIAMIVNFAYYNDQYLNTA